MNPSQILSLQLYSLRNFGDLDAQLDAARDAGYRLVEAVQSHLDDADAVRAKLDARGLAAPSAHVSLPALRRDLPGAVRAARVLGADRLYMPALPADERGGDAAQWRHAGRELGEMALRAGDGGMSLGYHNHAWELAVMADGRPALAHLFEGADGTPLTWQADVAWLARGGADPMRWLAEQSRRLTSVHVKDIAPAGTKQDEDGWTDVGSGTLDWPALWEASLTHGATLMVVEHDNPKHPEVFARASYEYLSLLPD